MNNLKISFWQFDIMRVACDLMLNSEDVNSMSDENNSMIKDGVNNDVWDEMCCNALTNVYTMLQVRQMQSFSSSCVIRDADHEYV